MPDPGGANRGLPAVVGRRLKDLRDRIEAAALRVGRDPSDVRLVAITKNAPLEAIEAAYAVGQREFGENRVQDALPKIDLLPDDVVWHLVGHLQSNKVNKVLGRFDLIESVDSFKLAEQLSVKSLAREITTAVMVEVNCSGDESKFGVAPAQAHEFCLALAGLDGILVQGLMTIGPLGGGETGAREAFRLLRKLRDDLIALDRPDLSPGVLSMGMSSDYEVAVEEGANLVRVGRAIFADLPVGETES